MKRWQSRFVVAVTTALYAAAGLGAQEYEASGASGYVPGAYIIELQRAPVGRASRLARGVARDRQNAIAAEQSAFTRAASQRGVRVAGSMRNVINAVLVRTESMTAEELFRLPGVSAVYRVPQMQHASVDAPLQLNGVVDGWARAGGAGRAGAGVKIGILDSGIDPTHPAFRDETLPMPPGFPRASPAANLALTSRKVIVARSYLAINIALGGRERGADTIVDVDGHGTSVAAIAAGGGPSNFRRRRFRGGAKGVVGNL